MTNNSKGFTLIEIMMVIAIIGILAAIAYPSYQAFVIKSNRGDAKTGLADMAASIEEYKLANSTYKGITLATIGSSGQWPRGGNTLYTVTLTPATLTDGTWLLQATPVATSKMKDDGSLMINHKGHTCWTKNGCTEPTGASNWDN